MYLFKFLARSIGLTIPVMLRMIPVVGITFFLVGVVVYKLAPYPLAIKVLAVVFGFPLSMLLAISAVRSALTQMRETSAPDLGKLFRKTMQLSAFHLVIAALFSLLTWFVASTLVPENWLENTSTQLQDADEVAAQTARAPINLPTVSQGTRPARRAVEPFRPAGDLNNLNPEGVERRTPEVATEPEQEEEPQDQALAEPEEPVEPEVQEEITSVVLEGEAVSKPTLRGFFNHVKEEYSGLAIGFYSVQGLYWLVLSALAVPFAAQAATIAARGPMHEFLWGTGKKTVYVFLLFVLSNILQLVGFLALTYYFGTSVTLALQGVGTNSETMAEVLASGGFYLGALLLLAFFTNCLIASGAAVAYVDSRAEMQRKKDMELGRILASAEQGPDIRALIRERSKGTALVKGDPGYDPEEIEDEVEDRPAIRPATVEDEVDDDFLPMILDKLDGDDPEDPAIDRSKSDVLSLEPSDKDVLSLQPSDRDILSLDPDDLTQKPVLELGEPDKPGDLSPTAEDEGEDDDFNDEDYDEDWFLKPLPSEIEAAEEPAEPEVPEQKQDAPEKSDKAEDDEEDIEWIRNLFKEEEDK